MLEGGRHCPTTMTNPVLEFRLLLAYSSKVVTLQHASVGCRGKLKSSQVPRWQEQKSVKWPRPSFHSTLSHLHPGPDVCLHPRSSPFTTFIQISLVWAPNMSPCFSYFSKVFVLFSCQPAFSLLKATSHGHLISFIVHDLLILSLLTWCNQLFYLCGPWYCSMLGGVNETLWILQNPRQDEGEESRNVIN